MLLQPGPGLLVDGAVSGPDDLLIAGDQMPGWESDEAHAVGTVVGRVGVHQLLVAVRLPRVGHGPDLPVFPVVVDLDQLLIVLGAHALADFLVVRIVVQAVLADGPFAALHGVHDPVGGAPFRRRGAGEEIGALVAHDDLVVLDPDRHVLDEFQGEEGTLDDGHHVLVFPGGFRDQDAALGIEAQHAVPDQFAHALDAVGRGFELIHVETLLIFLSSDETVFRSFGTGYLLLNIICQLAGDVQSILLHIDRKSL